MNKALLFLWVFLIPFFAYSKSYKEPIFSEGYKNKFTYQKFLCETENHYIFYKYPSHLLSSGKLKEFEILVFDKQMTLLETRRVRSIFKDKALMPENAEFFDGKIVLFSYYKSKKTNKIELYSQSYDPASLKLISDTKMVLYCPYQTYNFRWLSNFKFVVNDAKNGILILYPKYGKEKDSEPYYKASMLNKQLDILWQKDLKFSFPLVNIYLENIILKDTSKAYLLVRYMKSNKHRLGKPTSKFFIYVIEKGNSIYSQPISLHNGFKSITDCQIGINKNGELKCVGLYSENDYIIKGNFVISYQDLRKDKINIVYNPFKDGYINHYITKDVSKYDNLISETSVVNYSIHIYDIEFNEDNSYELIFEQFQNEYVEQRYDEKRFNLSSINIHSNIYVLFIDSMNKIKNTINIPKLQITRAYQYAYSSFVYAKFNNNYYFFFNDNSMNMFYNPTKPKDAFKKPGKTVLALVSANEKGVQNKEIIELRKDIDKLKILPFNCAQITKGGMLISYVQMARYKAHLIKITLE